MENNEIDVKESGAIEKFHPRKSLLVQRHPECLPLLESYQEEGLFVQEMYKLDNFKQLIFVYSYFTNGFSRKLAAEAAGYSSVNGNILLRKPVVMSVLAAMIRKTGILELTAHTNLVQLSAVDMADYDEFIEGTKTLSELREDGLDTSMILKATRGWDKNGQPWGKLDLPSKLAVTEAILRITESDRKTKEMQMQMNVGEQTINIVSAVPSQYDRDKDSPREDESKTTAKEVIEMEENDDSFFTPVEKKIETSDAEDM